MNDVPNVPAGNEFEQFLGASGSVPYQAQRWAQTGRFPVSQQHRGVAYSQSSLGNTGPVAAESGHNHTASDATIDAKPSTAAASQVGSSVDSSPE